MRILWLFYLFEAQYFSSRFHIFPYKYHTIFLEKFIPVEMVENYEKIYCWIACRELFTRLKRETKEFCFVISDWIQYWKTYRLKHTESGNWKIKEYEEN